MITLTGSSRSQDYKVYLDVEERRRLSGLRMLSGSIFRLSTTIPTFRQASQKGKRVFHFHFFTRLKRRGVRKNQSYSFRSENKFRFRFQYHMPLSSLGIRFQVKSERKSCLQKDSV